MEWLLYYKVLVNCLILALKALMGLMSLLKEATAIPRGYISSVMQSFSIANLYVLNELYLNTQLCRVNSFSWAVVLGFVPMILTTKVQTLANQ